VTEYFKSKINKFAYFENLNIIGCIIHRVKIIGKTEKYINRNSFIL